MKGGNIFSQSVHYLDTLGTWTGPFGLEGMCVFRRRYEIGDRGNGVIASDGDGSAGVLVRRDRRMRECGMHLWVQCNCGGAGPAFGDDCAAGGGGGDGNGEQQFLR